MTKWNHKTVYDALASRGLFQKPSDENKYVVLYPQDTICAILYPPKSICSREPVHLNAFGPQRARSWRMDIYQAIRPHISAKSRDSKNDPEQDFIHYSVDDWNSFAQALGLAKG